MQVVCSQKWFTERRQQIKKYEKNELVFETREEDKPKMLQQKKISAEECFEVEFQCFSFSYWPGLQCGRKEKKTNKQNYPILSHRTRKEFSHYKKKVKIGVILHGVVLSSSWFTCDQWTSVFPQQLQEKLLNDLWPGCTWQHQPEPFSGHQRMMNTTSSS